MASNFSEALNSVLKAYQEIGDEIPLLLGFQEFFSSNKHMRAVLVMMYEDVLDFHKEALRCFRQRCESSSEAPPPQELPAD